MMSEEQIQHIIEDLLPLYEEGLLSPETERWLEEQANRNKDFKNLLTLSKQSLPKASIQSPVDTKKMFQQIHRKLALYQIIFVALSFLLAIQTSLLNDSFGFILWYTVLGFVTFIFYKDMKIVFFISFLPIFLWSMGSNLMIYFNGHFYGEMTVARFFLEFVLGSLMLSIIHFVFAVIGMTIAWLVLKLKERN